MADLIVVCMREGRPARYTTRDLEVVAARLAPDNISPRPAQLSESPGVLRALVNPAPGHAALTDDRAGGGGAYVGGVSAASPDWWRTGSEPPDGTCVIVRHDAGRLELLTDICASRTAWYVQTDDTLLASTSQRALTALLGDVELDHTAATWLLASGTLGPLTAWDQRVRALAPDATLVLDRGSWQTRIEQRPAVFTPLTRPREEHVAALSAAITDTCAALGLDDGWLLPLSGGLDSRVLLAALTSTGVRPRCVTWTTRASLRNPLSDAAIAGHVARRFGAEHEYKLLDAPSDPLPAALDRFVATGEGRTDEFAGYVDGLAIWRDLFAAGVTGIVRGDESCGLRLRNASDAGSRRAAGAAFVSDFPDGHLLHRLGLGPQPWPSWMERMTEESGEAYCDRIDQQYYQSTVLAPLSAIKARYLEIVNPLLSRRVIGVVRELPDDVRMYASVLHAIATRDCGHIPFARFSSTPEAGDYLSDPDLVETMVRWLTSPAMAAVLSEEAATVLLTAVATPDRERPTAKARVRSALKTLRIVLPKEVGEKLTPRFVGPDPVSPRGVALRAVIAAKAIALLQADAGILRSSG